MLGRTKTVSRSDLVVNTTPADGNMVRVQKPKFLSLVGLPANQVAFKVVRKDEQGEHKMISQVIRRTKRSESSPVLRLTFPEGVNEADVGEALKSYGLSGYNIEQADGVFTATRSDLKSISNETTMQIKLSDAGLTATVARQEVVGEVAGEKQHIAVSSLEFDATKFNSDSVKEWLTKNSVDGALNEPQNPDQSYVVSRSDVAEGEETRRMALEDGVTAVIVRADVSNVPDGFVAIVSEAAYGGWGWGQLDFTSMMADVAFTDQMEGAMHRLHGLLQNIVLWSNLPLDVRKELTNRAMSQFGEYVSTVMDSLPRQLLVSVVRSANLNLERPMIKDDKSGAGGDNKSTTPPVVDNTPLTRSDVATMIADGIAAGFKAQADATAAEALKRADETPKEPVATETTPPAAEAPLTRSDFKAMVEEAVKPINEAVEQLKGITVVRGSGEPTQEAKKEVKQDVFRGSIPGLRQPQAK